MTAVALGFPRVRPAGTPSTVGRPDTEALVDRYGRVAHDLRISVTEKCSLRCTYCMPAEGLPAIPRDDLLTPAEIGRLVGIGYRLGLRDVRFTGGEPLMRPDLAEIIRRTRAAAPGVRISMTTNAIGLDRRIEELVDAGLDRVNISLDTVDREHFAELTRRDRLPQVLAGIQAALDTGLDPVKLNAVLMPETLAGAADLLAWAVEHGCRLRFIEQMPLDADQNWDRGRLVSAERLLAVLGERFDLAPVGREDPSAPAEEWAVDGGPTTVGIIASVTRSFCGDCDRTRITAEGTVRSCLFGNEEVDLRSLLRSGRPAGSPDDAHGTGPDDAARRAADDDDADADAAIVTAWQGAMWAKPFAHGLDRGAPDTGAIGGLATDPEAFARTERSMGAIGG